MKGFKAVITATKAGSCHWIIELFMLKKSSTIIEFPQHCQGHTDQVPKGHIWVGFNSLQGRGLHHCAGQPVPMLDHPLWPSLVQLDLFPLVLPLVTCDKSPTPVWHSLLLGGYREVWSPLSLLFSRLNTSTSLSCCSELHSRPFPTSFPSLDLFQPLNLCLVMRSPQLMPGFKVQPHQCWVQTPLMLPWHCKVTRQWKWWQAGLLQLC